MDGIAVSRKRADVDVICVEGLSELKERCFVLEKHGGVALGFPRIPTRAYLDGVNADMDQHLDAAYTHNAQRMAAVRGLGDLQVR